MNKRNYILATALIILGVLSVVLLIQKRIIEPTSPTSSMLTPTSTAPTNTGSENVIQEPSTGSLGAEKPESLTGVEVTTYRSQYGYDITYPLTWKAQSHDASLEDGVLDTWTLTPVEPPEYLNPLVVIVVYDVATDIYEGMYAGTGTNRTLLEPYPSQGRFWIDVKDIGRVYTTDSNEGVSVCNFLKEGRRYHITLNDTFLAKAGLSETELQWVLSTFKLTQ